VLLRDSGLRHGRALSRHDEPNGEAEFDVLVLLASGATRSTNHGRTASTNAAESRQQIASKVQPGRELPMMM
jgi:hypothetical protein